MIGQARIPFMNFRIIVVGKPALAHAKAATDDYLKRLGRHGNHELIVIKAGSSEEVSEKLLERSEGCFRIVLDERGKALTTREFHEHIERLRMRGDIKSVAFLIGAADGHSDEMRQKADLLLQVSSFTLQHELALVVLLEQLYRIASIDAGSPYHRD